KLEVHVCEVCAKKKGYMSSPEEAYTLHDLLTGLFNIDSPKVHNQEASLNQVKVYVVRNATYRLPNLRELENLVVPHVTKHFRTESIPFYVVFIVETPNISDRFRNVKVAIYT